MTLYITGATFSLPLSLDSLDKITYNPWSFQGPLRWQSL